MITKTSKVVDLLVAGSDQQAVAIAKDFKLGLTKQERDTIVRAHEMTWNPTFYEMLGYRADGEMNKAVEILRGKLL